MPCDYDQIRADNIREYGEGTRHLSFLGRLYTDRTHFLFELLQNAEDAGATRVLFHLFEGKLKVFHDGRLFNEKDVRGICGVGEGTKAEDLTQIGKFGIGFKSVYAYTTTPEIHSGHESFRIENYVRPYAVQPRGIGDSWTTLFVFPFNKEDVESVVACREISARLRKLSARTLLFLRKIQEIEYRLPDGTDGVYLRDEAARGAAREITVIGQSNGEDESESWLIFERPVDVPDPGDDCPRHVQVEVGFRLEKIEKDRRDEIVRVKDSPLVVYFPTEKETRFGFLIQGPYKTTPARDNIPKDDDWNATLVRETARLIADVLPEFKDLGLLGVSLLDALPIRMDNFPPGSMFYPIVAAVRESLAAKELLPTDDDSFVAARNAKLARGADLRKLLDQDQLTDLFQSENTIKWLAGSITQDRTPELRTYLLNELDVEEVTPDSFARKITQSFLLKQIDEWLLKFYGYLSGQEALWRSPRWSGDSGGTLRSKPIVRLQDDSQVTPFRADGTTQNAFLPPPEDTDFPIVKRSIAGDEQAGNFLKRLGLSEPDVFDDIVERVLPKYLKEDFSLISETEHTADILKILRALTSDSEAGKKKVIGRAKQTPFLRAVDPAGNFAFKKPCDIYHDSPDLSLYFSGSADVWFLSEKALASATDSSVLSELGVAILPRRILFSDGLPPGVREYSTRGETVENYELHGLVDFLDSLESAQDFEDRTKSALLLWGYLKEHLESDSWFFKGRYHWFYYSSHSKSFDSQMLTRLRNTKWIPTQHGSMEKPGDITTDQLFEEFQGANELIDVLGISQGVGPGAVSEEERKREHADQLGVSLEDIEFLKKHPDEFARLKAAMASRDDRPSFPSRTVANPERRQERVREQLADSPEKDYEERERSVRTTRGSVDPSIWLREQYTNDDGQMVCQICKEEMPFRKRDGQYYFEAVEALSIDYFKREHEAQFLALCPVCAARYKEFVKLDKSAMEELNQALRTSDEGEVTLNLGELETSIKFVGSHFIEMKAILEVED
ncbi:sacsin N-terminal ATP-binding-like domain-containing protein [Desulfobulbus alkaliphilus]|uniref:sacsin N-terminal ATP-binding-like domain-containing protein n=1 Tax=Desulfobulbus alkaliphilus TaxID=869814 RepID=UPI001966AFCE|nr:hypothetical protein [Desulfobulbus alkaliphilus]MBM9536678.1 hypothetical protein [Desulfobulbus alkaliphilus]